MRNIERLTLTGNEDINGTGNDVPNVVTGNAGNNMLNGGAGNDRVAGNDGDDTLVGGTGADILTGGGGADFIDGGTWQDTAVFSGNRTDNEFTPIGGVNCRSPISTLPTAMTASPM
jgi:Ca2+-binding RTX toxin-like protein